ncbi:MAG: hypothetical protein ACJA2G_003644, partial [Cognaticolwellia sp.]
AKTPANTPVVTNVKMVGILFVINSMIFINYYLYF